MTRFVLVDFETASACDLKKAGAWRYAEDFTTEVLCLAYTLDGQDIRLWKPGEEPDEDLRRAISNPACMFLAFNAGFEKAIWRHIMCQQYRWPDVPNDRWHDPQAVCAMKGIPVGLDRALHALGLGAKDKAGTKVTLSFSKIDKKTGKLGGSDKDRDLRLARVYSYCADDIKQELAVHRRIKGLGEDERKVWLLDQTINERGVRLDLDFVDAAQAICDQAAEPLLHEFRTLTGFNPGQRDRLLKFLAANGTVIEDTKKETIEKLLGETDEEDDSLAGELEEWEVPPPRLPDVCRRTLEIRSILGSASIKKLASMRACVGFDGRARGLLQYHGAGPGRWAGRLLQPQNFPRPNLKISGEAHDTEQLVSAIMSKDAEFVRCLFGEPINAVASGLRHALISSFGTEFVVGDFATVEARIVLALAGQHDKTALIASGQDIYIDMAETIFDQVVTKKEHPELRQTGKNTVLGCGFQMGWKKFRARYAPDKSEAFARACIDAYRNDFAPLVPTLWYGLEEAAVETVWTGRPHEHAGIQYKIEDGFLTCRLPSGRRLWYYDPRPIRKAMPWDKNDIRKGFQYSAYKLGQWKRVDAYGGLLTENVVQATARDLLVASMFKCEANGLPIILTVHDENICEAKPSPGNNKLLEHLMCDMPQWARDLKIPVGAEVWSGTRYRK